MAPRPDGDASGRAVRFAAMLLVWVAGAAAALLGLLVATARYGCGVHDRGLACRHAGSLLGVVLVVAAIGVVAAVTLRVAGRPTRDVLPLAAVAAVVLVALVVVARLLLDTV